MLRRVRGNRERELEAGDLRGGPGAGNLGGGLEPEQRDGEQADAHLKRHAQCYPYNRA